MDRRVTPYQRKKKATPKSVSHSLGCTIWTPDEDEVLRRAVFKHGGKKWKTIATFFQQKTPSQCNQRWNELQNHGSAVKKPWCPNEDMRMIELVKTHGAGKWAVIASYLPGRNGKQCRERWHNQLNPAIKKGPWTTEEDEIIMEMQSKYGNRWAKITEKLPGRTDNAVKNHWHSSMKAKLKRSSGFISSQCISTNELTANHTVVKDEPTGHEPLSVRPEFPHGVRVKLEPGSSSPDSVAMCPSQLDPRLRCDDALFLLDGAIEPDEALHNVLPPAEICKKMDFSYDDLSSDDAGADSDEDDTLSAVFDGIDPEELVLSTDHDDNAILVLAETAHSSHDSFIMDDNDSDADDDFVLEPSQHDTHLLPSLPLMEENPSTEILEVLSDVSDDDMDISEFKSVRCEPDETVVSLPTVGLGFPHWYASVPSPSTLQMSSPPSPMEQQMTPPPVPMSTIYNPFHSVLVPMEPLRCTWGNEHGVQSEEIDVVEPRVVWD